MTLSLGMITVDTQDAESLGGWWAQQLGGKVLETNDGWFVRISIGEGRPFLAFQKVDDPTPGKNRLHLDLTTDDRVGEVARLTAAGATVVAEEQMPGFAWTVLADPDGNQFCVAQHDGS